MLIVLRKGCSFMKQKKNPFAIILIILVVFLLSAFSFFGYKVHLTMKNIKANLVSNLPEVTETSTPINEEDEALEPVKEPEPRITCAILGTDKDVIGAIRTDTIIVVTYDPATNKVDAISVPRDTEITLPDDIHTEMSALRYVPQTLKINAVYNYTDRKNWSNKVLPVIEEVVQLPIDHYVLVDSDLLISVVDAVGGITYSVPYNMNYDDDIQSLHIHLNKGEQVLNGNQAEMVMRFRKNNDGSNQLGDIGRIAMQQDFLMTMADQILNSLSVKNIIEIGRISYDSIETDMSLFDMMGYASSYLPIIDINNIRFHTLWGYGNYIIDEFSRQVLLDDILYGNEPSTFTGAYKSLSMIIQNGGYINGLAHDKEQQLLEDGFTTIQTGDTTELRVPETRIIVRKRGMEKHLLPYFNKPLVACMPDYLPEDTDVVIILGTEEKTIDE